MRPANADSMDPTCRISKEEPTFRRSEASVTRMNPAIAPSRKTRCR